MALNEALHRALLGAGVMSELDEEPIDMRDKEDESKVIEMAETRMREEEQRAKEIEASIDPSVLLPSEDMTERARFIPLRLSYEERKSLRLVIAAINVSDYTSVVDMEFKSKAKRHHTQLQVIPV
jgi:hypothetical protein